MEVYSIGFTQKTAEQFFGLLKDAGIRRLLDVRLNNTSQLSGFTKREDLEYFLGVICAEYVHEPLLAPTQMLDDYKKRKGSWDEYEGKFLDLMKEREVEKRIDSLQFLVPTVLLCSEPTPQYCHRRLVLDYLQGVWGNLAITHL